MQTDSSAARSSTALDPGRQGMQSFDWPSVTGAGLVGFSLGKRPATWAFVMKRYAIAFWLPVLVACSDGGGYFLERKPSPEASGVPASASSVGADLILPLEVDLQVAETFVRIGFGLNKGQRFQSTEFLTPRLRTSQAVPLIRLVKQYNEFDGQRVAAAVETLRGRVSGIEFGREGSPVLYIELPYWTHQREETTTAGVGVKIPEADNDKFIAELKQLFVVELKADEFSVNRHRVRVWWD